MHTAMQTALTATRTTTAQPASLHAALSTGLPAGLQLGWSDLLPHRAALVAYARRRLLDPSLAEDLVHDVFEAVVTGRAVFGGRAALRSWLVAVLKHKIVDLVRQRSGHDSLDAGHNGDDDEQTQAELVCPQPGPAEVAEQRQRLRGLLSRIQALPSNLREVVNLRLLQERETSDVCRTLAITEQNLFVRLHRARRALVM